MADPKKQFFSAITESANRGEVTALLIRSGFRVYRPEADVYGEDLVVWSPNSETFHAVQLKGRPIVDKAKYGGRNIWMLFPSARYNPSVSRDWFLVPHDEFLSWVAERHTSVATTGHWSYPTISKDLAIFLQPYVIVPPVEGHEEKFQQGSEGVMVTRNGVDIPLSELHKNDELGRLKDNSN